MFKMRSMPYCRFSPIAMTAYSPPMSSPLTVRSATSEGEANRAAMPRRAFVEKKSFVDAGPEGAAGSFRP